MKSKIINRIRQREALRDYLRDSLTRLADGSKQQQKMLDMQNSEPIRWDGAGLPPNDGRRYLVKPGPYEQAELAASKPLWTRFWLFK